MPSLAVAIAASVWFAWPEPNEPSSPREALAADVSKIAPITTQAPEPLPVPPSTESAARDALEDPAQQLRREYALAPLAVLAPEIVRAPPPERAAPKAVPKPAPAVVEAAPRVTFRSRDTLHVTGPGGGGLAPFTSSSLVSAAFFTLVASTEAKATVRLTPSGATVAVRIGAPAGAWWEVRCGGGAPKPTPASFSLRGSVPLNCQLERDGQTMAFSMTLSPS